MAMLFKASVLLGLAGLINAIDPITVRGNAFFAGDSRFYIRGVDYQPGGSSDLEDPLADTSVCERDLPYFQQLGINTIRVYSIDNTADHDECMQKYSDAGIYLIADLNIPLASIARDSGAACSYNSLYLEQVFATVLALSKYDNVLGFFAGNEVVNNDETGAAPYVKAVVRDVKNFIKNRNLRTIPVGYSAADTVNGLQTAEYFNCGDDEMARVDMFGFNDYSWCGDASFTTSGYDQKVAEYGNYSLPLFFSEFGCNTITPRPFTEIETIYSTKMSSVFSGGLVYEYSEAANNYGLVSISSDNSSITTNTDFTNLQSEYNKTQNPSGDGGYHNSTYSNCPGNSDIWNATTTLPDTPLGALAWLNNDADPQGAGFNGNTQWACVDGNNNIDNSNSTTKASSTSSATSSAGGSSSSSGSQSSSTSSSSKKNDGLKLVDSVSWMNGAGLVGIVAGMALL